MKKFLTMILTAGLIAVLLTGCDSSDYKKASALYDEGNYKEAIAIFEALEDYEDSADRLIECKYMYAEALYNAGSYEEALKLYNEIPNHLDSEEKAASAAREIMYITYADVFAALNEGAWFYASDSVNAVNVITFTNENANMRQIYYDGNGQHTTADNLCNYAVDDTKISVTLADGSAMDIPYTAAEGAITLGSGEYFTPQQVDAGLQGYWGIKDTSYNPITGFSTSEYIYNFNKGKVTFEKAAEAYGYDDGSYYYYGPYSGTYTVTADGLVVDARNEWQFGFVISEGKVAMSRCGKTLSVYKGFKGEDGYSF